MATRNRIRKIEENTEPIQVKMEGIKLGATRHGLLDTRKAFGDIHNKQSFADLKQMGGEKDKKSGAVYKDIKPRVDTRWTKPTVPVLKPTKSVPVALTTKQIVTRQVSKPELITTKQRTIANVSSVVPVLIKKETELLPSILTSLDSRKEIAADNHNRFGGLIKSPVSIKVKNEKSEKVLANYYDSHSLKLLHQIENIDEKDKSNPQLLSEYVNDIYAYLFKLEDQFPIRENFLSTQQDVTPKMRSVLLDWINEVHHQFGLEIETYHMAVSMIDRYLQTNATTTRRYLQLVGVTILFMASKYEELMPPDITDFVYVTDDTYSKLQILQMEKTIFKALQFHLGKPLPIHFLRRFAKAAGTLGDRQYNTAKYFIELVSVDYEMTKYKPSQIAAASLYLSLFIMNKMQSNDNLWTPTLKHYSTYTSAELMPIVRRIATMATAAGDAKLKSVYTKYSHAHYKFTSTIPEMSGTKIYSLINNRD